MKTVTFNKTKIVFAFLILSQRNVWRVYQDVRV